MRIKIQLVRKTKHEKDKLNLGQPMFLQECQLDIMINLLRLYEIHKCKCLTSSHLILCHPLFLLPPVPSSIIVFPNESTPHMKCPKYWSFSFNISPSKEIPGLISFRMDCWISLQSKGLSRVFSNTTVQKHKFSSVQLSSQSNSHIHT